MNTAPDILTSGNRSDMAAIIGLGKTGISVANYLGRQGVACEGFDEHAVSTPDSLHIPVHIGKLNAKILNQFGKIIVSPGVNWNHPALCAARDASVPVAGDLDLFRDIFHGELVAVTGTNGKTTTVTLIGILMDTLHGGIEVAGNIGKPMLDLFDDTGEPERVVLELSSFQLERAGIIHPRWAALLNVQPDHADMHSDAQAYEAAKLRLFEAQGEGDTAMLPNDEHWHPLAENLAGRGVRVHRFGYGTAEYLCAGVQILDAGNWQIFWRHGDRIEYIQASELTIRGMHQHMNLAVAAQAAADFGVSPSVIRLGLLSFRGLEHRLQSLGIIDQREWIDDSKATNPDAAIAALSAFDQVIWICGGLHKDVDLSGLQDTVIKHVTHAFIIGKDPKPYADLCLKAGVQTTIAGTIQQAVKQAARTQPGLPVLLSPAAASQDQFRDYNERGRAFAEAARALENQA
jgi:UDP-N-acetylmuramoylalanine--D-glutamate ligase